MRQDIRNDNFNGNIAYKTTLANPNLYKIMDDVNSVIDQINKNKENHQEMGNIELEDDDELNYANNMETNPNINQSNNEMYQVDKKPAQIIKPKKKAKPAFAMTEQQHDEQVDQECDELLDFFDNTNFDSYVDDLETQNLMSSIKKRVDELKNESDWQKKWDDRLKSHVEKKREINFNEKEKAKHLDDDMQVYSDAGNMFGDAKSVASERTQESISEIKKKMKEQQDGQSQWDGNTRGQQMANQLEDR